MQFDFPTSLSLPSLIIFLKTLFSANLLTQIVSNGLPPHLAMCNLDLGRIRVNFFCVRGFCLFSGQSYPFLSSISKPLEWL